MVNGYYIIYSSPLYYVTLFTSVIGFIPLLLYYVFQSTLTGVHSRTLEKQKNQFKKKKHG
jgi:hypothetical protein